MGIFKAFSREKKESLDKGLEKSKENFFTKLYGGNNLALTVTDARNIGEADFLAIVAQPLVRQRHRGPPRMRAESSTVGSGDVVGLDRCHGRISL